MTLDRTAIQKMASAKFCCVGQMLFLITLTFLGQKSIPPHIKEEEKSDGRLGELRKEGPANQAEQPSHWQHQVSIQKQKQLGTRAARAGL